MKIGSALSNTSERGFTLLELVVAAGLVVMVSIVVAALFGRSIRVWRRADQNLQELFVIEKSFYRLEGQVRNAVSVADHPFEGSSNRMSFMMAENSVQLREVTYPDVLKGVKSLAMEYGYLKKSNETAAEIQWKPEWKSIEQKAQLPKLFRVRLEMENRSGQTASVVREFIIPQGVLGTLTANET